MVFRSHGWTEKLIIRMSGPGMIYKAVELIFDVEVRTGNRKNEKERNETFS